ncbi:glutamate synthase [Sulfurifustis variabilis]|uniref:Glutamate synthase n=1 Tax=Sulfurifustis variabilis TaxID=1675686 RepID=A0A1B4V069_9GAMM|nr:DUF3365 domain-containing protein [Sulfurifustis variabilis]BAU46839.1 glutamate synthase [Sulfurifustis variabilis]
MKRWVLIGLLAAAVPGFAADDASRVAASRAAAKEFMETLKGELQAAMKTGGPTNAIEVCHTKAPAIAREISRAKGFDIGRTSLKTRNPDNAPDAWERKVLEDFEARKRAGADPATLEHHETVTANGKATFRYMKAIPTAELCLNCHGRKLDPKVSATLKRLYPEDQATGFNVGDLRGAFTVAQPL